jgi:hypothetical protein
MVNQGCSSLYSLGAVSRRIFDCPDVRPAYNCMPARRALSRILPMAKLGAIPQNMTPKNKAAPPRKVTCKFCVVFHVCHFLFIVGDVRRLRLNRSRLVRHTFTPLPCSAWIAKGGGLVKLTSQLEKTHTTRALPSTRALPPPTDCCFTPPQSPARLQTHVCLSD